MAQSDRANAPLGLSRLARVVYDKGIDHGRLAQQGIGPAVCRKGHGFTRQPFQRAMRAHMDKGVGGAALQPKVKRHIRMTRGARQIVIAGIAGQHIAPFGLQRDDRAAMTQGGKLERRARCKRIIFGRAPSGVHRILQGLGQAR